MMKGEQPLCFPIITITVQKPQKEPCDMIGDGFWNYNKKKLEAACENTSQLDLE